MKYLFTSEDLEGDPEFMVAVIEAESNRDFYPGSDAECVYIPERVMERILGVGKAYQLKFPEHASENLSDRWAYRSGQVEWVIDELGFLQSLLNDQLLQIYLSKVMALASKVRCNPNKLVLIFEGP